MLWGKALFGLKIGADQTPTTISAAHTRDSADGFEVDLESPLASDMPT
jgi:hypothetical protein